MNTTLVNHILANVPDATAFHVYDGRQLEAWLKEGRQDDTAKRASIPTRPAHRVADAGRVRARRQQQSRERGDIFDAVAILGLPIRTVEAMAVRGDIPGAAKIGRRWTFDLSALRGFVKQQERETWQRNERPLPVAIGAKVSSGAVSRSTAEISDGRFTQITRRLRGNDGKRAKRGQ